MINKRFVSDYFTDYSGMKRRVTFCGVLEKDFGYSYLNIGVAVQYPGDKDSEELGRIIAFGKANKYKSRIASFECSGHVIPLTPKIVDSILEQELVFFKNNPGKYLKGYDKSAKRNGVSNIQ
jgi:hypothetical protein